MSRYDFDTPVDRRHTGAMKWNIGENELPMWVADMDFKTAPEIIDAMYKRIDHGVFGYNEVGDDWYDAYIGWWERRHGLKMDKEWLIFSTGVIPTLSSAVRKLTSPNENVVILTPVYNIFYNSILNNGARVLECELTYDGVSYDIDWADLEDKLADPQTSLMILCNPHNPVGKIWDLKTLEKIGWLAYKNNVVVISDEIHCDLTEPGTSYTPFIAASDICKDIGIMCMAPTKAFNMAGIQTSAVCVPDPYLRHKIWRALNTDEVAEPNVLATVAAVAAFNEGEAWLDELNAYLSHNRKTVSDFIDDMEKKSASENKPSPKLVRGEATYLMWIDMSAYDTDADTMQDIIRDKTGLYLSTGSIYGKGGEKFLRMNIACPRSTLMDGLKRFKEGVRYL